MKLLLAFLLSLLLSGCLPDDQFATCIADAHDRCAQAAKTPDDLVRCSKAWREVCP